VPAESPIGIGLMRPDLLGTYGDSGNAVVLARRLQWRGIAAEVVPLGPGATVPDHVQVLVIGGGEDAAQLALLRDTVLLRGLERAVGRGAAVLAVCAGMQVLGHSFGGSDGVPYQGVGMLDCVTDRLDARAVGETVVDPTGGPLAGPTAAPLDGGGQLLAGFENHGGRTVLGPDSVPLGRVTVGVGNGDGFDGAVTGRVVGTYLHGPVLPRNPVLADALLEWVVGPLEPLPVPLADRLHRERLAAAAGARAEVAAEAARRTRSRVPVARTT
jgi:CobQ-like glutamine amidotransferase family enzyme